VISGEKPGAEDHRTAHLAPAGDFQIEEHETTRSWSNTIVRFSNWALMSSSHRLWHFIGGVLAHKIGQFLAVSHLSLLHCTIGRS